MTARIRPEDDPGLAGKVAIVTGAGAEEDGIGIGRATAVLLARAGAHVVAVGRRKQRIERTLEMIVADGGSGSTYVADVTDEAQCASLVRDTVERFGRLDLLDNNVGVAAGTKGSVVDVKPEVWRRIMQINVESMFLASRHAIPAMIRTAGGGAIVNVSSLSALRPLGRTAYSVSKGAVIALTRAMAVDHGPSGIRVNCVAPGPVHTPMVGARAMSPETREVRRRASVLGVEGNGWDVGHAVRFLLSNHARFITGQVLVVDGGSLLRGPPRPSD